MVELEHGKATAARSPTWAATLGAWVMPGLLTLAAWSHADEALADPDDETTASLTSPTVEIPFSDASLPGNPNAIDHCLAKIRVSSARLRAAPSLGADVVGMRLVEQSVFVEKVMGKWAQVVLEEGDTAYIAAYLLTFSWQDLLEQWKKGAPPPTVGKKAKVKWASAVLRPYPSKAGGSLGRLRRHDRVGMLGDARGGWSLVQVDGAIGFMATRALAEVSTLRGLSRGPALHAQQAVRAYASAPLARLKRGLGDGRFAPQESPAQYLARTAWSPELFRLQQAKRGERRGPGAGDEGAARIALGAGAEPGARAAQTVATF